MALSSTWAYCSQRVSDWPAMRRRPARPGTPAPFAARVPSRAGRTAVTNASTNAARRRRSAFRRERQAGAQGLGIANHEFAVEHEQLLQRHGRHGPLFARDIGVGEIEQPQQTVEVMAADNAIQRAAAIVGAGSGSADGPPVVRSSVPATASMASRQASTSNRLRFMRQTSLFSGSTVGVLGRRSGC